ncbi:MAG TPA: helix-turn-helix domain-containing protein [Thermomicrobiaceae bacterium]|nr:helix-turn-helix domain-containing protein [Thermomicrobiaceae bacterium]
MSTICTPSLYYASMGTESVSFSTWLDDEMQRRGWSVSDLARRLDVAPAQVSNWLNGKRGVSSASCRKIAAVLEIDPLVVLYHAGHVATLPQPESAYERARRLREIERQLQGLQIEEVRTEEPVPVHYYGVVPADTLRWVSGEGSDAVRLVPPSWMGRSPRDFLVVTASGDCLLPRGIADGHDVLIERANGRAPQNGQIILIRVEDEYSLKIWQRDGDWIELRDGHGNVVRRLSILAEFEIIGFYKANWFVQP